MKSNRLMSVLLVLIMFIVFSCSAYAAGVPATNTSLKITNYAYSSYVANVYTSGNPASGKTISLYSPSGSNCQRWKNVKCTDKYGNVDNFSYMIACYDPAYSNLVMNYNQNTTLCTLYDYRCDTKDDYIVNYLLGDYDTVVNLVYRSRFLGASGSGNGASVYWYPRNATMADNWVFTAW